MTFDNKFLDRLSAEVKRKKQAPKAPQKPPKATTKPVVTNNTTKPTVPFKASVKPSKSASKPAPIKFAAGSPEWQLARRNRVLKSFDAVSTDVILSSTNHLSDAEFELTIAGLERDLAKGVL